MRIIGLNIRAGGGRRVRDLLAYLDRQDPHTVVLTEWRDGLAGGQITAWAQSRGMHFASLNDGGTANGAFIASMEPFQMESRRPAEVCAGVVLLARFRGFGLLGCYFPIGKQKASFFTQCAQIASQHSATPLLVLGDLNTGNQVADREPGSGKYFCAEDFDGLTAQHGLHELWRRCNRASTREWTWLSNRQNGYRLDHALANAAFVAWAAADCRYDHAPRTTGLTDHSAVVVTCSNK